ncbi:MAG: MxaP protein [Methylomonas sp.]|nr:MxaP protein [Methylomonas sp.]PPD20217.1 MAG: MxaP protein [Methylomonas sp.]PPD26264.1 MAG: MxaP protein [Methylomonas sp.]PPD37981.1 MAG: MxaP protein [Methylomonas sp.]PPD40363.1 MAG: MxaP protein [Methylomonas sp.]
MNIKECSQRIIPQSGLGHYVETYLTWAGVGLIGAFVATTLDAQADLAYAAFYTNAVNDAVGYNFWILLAVIGLLLFSVTLPLIYLSLHFPRLKLAVDPLRGLSYIFFLVAFDEGGLMIGILLANWLHISDKAALLADKSFLFSDVGLLPILALTVINSFLWLLGESIHNRNTRHYSGLVSVLMAVPIKYLAPGYLGGASLVLYLILEQ